MALTFRGTINSLKSGQLPTGYVRPTVVKTTAPNFEFERTLTILKATVENATKSTTMTNIIGNATIGIDKQISDEIGNFFDDGLKTIEAHAELVSITHNLRALKGNDPWLGTTAISYTVVVKVFVNVT